MELSQEEKIKHEKGRVFLMWLGIGSIVMAFAGLTSAYIVRRGDGNWLEFQLPGMFYISTAVILISSVTINLALSGLKKGNKQQVKSMLLITLLLGFAFMITQFLAWGDLTSQNIFFTGKASNAAGSFLYVLTGLHLAHLVGGIISLIVVNVRNILGKYSSEDFLGVRICAIYWHFLDGLWVYLFLFLLFIR